MNFQRATFISITKTGSTSVRRWLWKNLGEQYRPVGTIPVIKPFEMKKIKSGLSGLRSWFPEPGERAGADGAVAVTKTSSYPTITDFHCHRLSVEETARLYAELGAEWKLFEFACVRNPLDRLVSGFHDKRFHPALSRYDFKGFIMNREKLIPAMPIFEFNHTFRLQTQFPIQNCKVLLRTETLAKDWKRLCGTLGMDYQPLGTENVGSYKRYTQFWDREMLEYSYEYLRPDFEFLGYRYPI